MGKKKPFIDKKRATTYHLTYNNNESLDNNLETQEEDNAPSGIENDAQTDNGLETASLYSDYAYGLSKERRREIVALGLPDDGYDYLKHLRAMGPSRPVAMSVAGPSHSAAQSENGRQQPTQEDAGPSGPTMYLHNPKFVPPAEDVQLHDARALQVVEAGEEGEADEAMAVVSAMARAARVPSRGRLQEELAEVSTAMDGITLPGVRVEGEEFGDWMDEFVVEASAGGAVEAIDEGVEDDELDGEDSEVDDDEDGEEDEDVHRSGGAGSRSAGVPRGSAAPSVASTYLRPERRDRRGELADLDQRFERLAVEYEDEEVGELDDHAEARGHADLADFGDVLDSFLSERGAAGEDGRSARPGGSRGRAKGDDGGEEDDDGGDDYDDEDEDYDEEYDEDDGEMRVNGQRHRALGGRRARELIPGPGEHKVATLQDKDEEVIRITKARLAAAEASAKASGAPVREVAMETVLVVDETERWDCESVLSLRTNTEHHPSRIAEPRKIAAGTISLSSKTGLPRGYGAAASAAPGGAADGQAGSADGSADLDNEEGAAAVLLVRQKGETNEERKARKAAVKEAQRSARAAKKETKLLFKHEGARQQKMSAGKMTAGSILSMA